jgi:hypothetical protein
MGGDWPFSPWIDACEALAADRQRGTWRDQVFSTGSSSNHLHLNRVVGVRVDPTP